MNPTALQAEILRLTKDANELPSEELVFYAAEHGWIGLSRENMANNLRNKPPGPERRRQSLIDLQWHIFRGFMGEFFHQTVKATD